MKEKLKVAAWARAEQRRKNWKSWRADVFGQVRLIFAFLFLLTASVFIFDHQMQFESLASREVHHAFTDVKLDRNLRSHAENYEKAIDQINR